MSDFTAMDTPEVDDRHVRRARERREYNAYFALIFLAALPLAILAWSLSVLRHFKLPETSPIKSALSQARTVTPLIFSA